MITENSTKIEVMEAVKQDSRAFDFAGEELQKDIDVMTEVLRHIIKRN